MKPIVIHYTDDDHDDLDFFRDALDSIDQNVVLHTYNTSQHFLEILDTPPPIDGIVFLDVNIPGKNGFDILERMRNNEEYRDVPVVMYSTSDNPSYIERSQELGANMYAVKPNSFNSLISMVQRIISNDFAVRSSNFTLIA